MIFEVRTPSLLLQPYVEMLTFYADFTAGYEMERLLPEGVIEVIIDLTERPKAIYHNEYLYEIQSCRTAWISGMRNRFITINAGGINSSMFVIRFKPGMAHPFLQIPIAELNHRVVEADSILKQELTGLREQILNVVSVDVKFQIVERYLIQKLRQSADMQPVVYYAIQQIINNPATITIQHIVEKTGYSHKHFLALFSKYVGFNPKQFLRIVKFQQVIHRLEQTPQLNWTQIAYDSGYYDQAHFINDFKAFSGFKPMEYMNKKGDIINYIPII
ncbi:MAG: helix-turn-helix domain-containing protein [Saprospiraceae bacterium]